MSSNNAHVHSLADVCDADRVGLRVVQVSAGDDVLVVVNRVRNIE